MRGNRRCGIWRRANSIASHSHARLEELAQICPILRRDALRYRLQALEARRRLEECALLTAVQRRVALRARSGEICAGGQRGRAVVASRCSHSLNHTRQTRTRHIDGRPRALLAWTFVPALKTIVRVFTAGVLIAVLSVLTIAVHIAVDSHSLVGLRPGFCAYAYTPRSGGDS